MNVFGTRECNWSVCNVSKVDWSVAVNRRSQHARPAPEEAGGQGQLAKRTESCAQLGRYRNHYLQGGKLNCEHPAQQSTAQNHAH